ADFIPGPAEGWLTLLLLAAWGFLLALLVLEEPLVGDRQFWITRPYRWPALLAAKLVFAALFIHLPSLLADCAILAARSFSPVAVLVLQYARRRTILSRALAGAALVLAAALFVFTPREDTFALQCALSPISAASRAPSIHIAPRSEEPPSGLRQVFSPKSVVTLAIPIELSGITDGVKAR